MFSRSSTGGNGGAGRPVPSKAALRALYQLAYISSGTAVGIATLCAEERRRQTHLLQTIADNAKRLRSSPRYVGNAQAGADAEELAVDSRKLKEGGSTDLGANTREGARQEAAPASEPGQRINSRIRNRRSSWYPSHRPMQDVDLPSRVAKAYRQISTIGVTPMQDRTSEPSGDVVRLDGHGYEGSQAERVSQESQEVGSPPPHMPLHDRTVGMQMLRTPGYERIVGQDTLYLRFQPGRQSKIYESVMDRKRRRRRAPLRSNADDSTSLQAGIVGNAVVGLIRDEVESFFRSVPFPKDQAVQELEAADRLLEMALKEGSMSEVRSLLLWRFATGNEMVPYAQRICALLCEHINRFEAHKRDEELFDMLQDLFTTGAVQRLPQKLQVELGLHVLDGALVRFGEQSRPEMEKLFLHEIWDAVGMERALSDLDTLMRSLLKERRFHLAMRLIDEWHSYGAAMPTALLDRIYRVAHSQARLAICSTVLQKKIRQRVHDTILTEQCETFIMTCSRKGRYHMLRGVLEILQRNETLAKLLIAGLSERAQAVLAHACEVDENVACSATLAVQQGFGPSLRDEIFVWHCSASIKRIWQTTHNLDLVERSLGTFRKDARSRNLSEEQVRSVFISFVEVMASAGHYTRALDILSHMSKNAQDNAHVLAASLAVLARKGSWDQFHELLEMMQQGQLSLSTAPATAKLNEALYHFSLHHSPAEVRALATRMVDSLGLPLHRTTTDIVLQCFVRGRKLSMISKWLEYVGSKGGPTQLETATSANLLTHYYLEHRPPHAFLLDLCRIFLAETGCKHHRHFIELAQECVAYDLRHISGNKGNSPDVRRLVDLNRQRFANCGDKFPMPFTMADLGPGQEVRGVHRQPRKLSEVGIVKAIQSDEPAWSNFADSSLSFNEVREERDHHYTSLGRPRTLERRMIFELSSENYEAVLDMYHASLSPTGIPPSPRVLEIAVEACLAINHDRSSEADHLISKARHAGMNITCASGPLLIREIATYASDDQQTASSLRARVIDYYRMNEEHGWRVQHHVGVHAANALITNRSEQHGIDLLNAIYHSEWATKRPYDITAMTVYMKGYVALRDLSGVRWVVSNVIQKNIRIDAAFTRTLRQLWRDLREHVPKGQRSNRTWRLYDLLQSASARCCRQRAKQKKESGRSGWRLLRCLIKCSKPDRASHGLNVLHKNIGTRSRRARIQRRMKARLRPIRSRMSRAGSSKADSSPLTPDFAAVTLQTQSQFGDVSMIKHSLRDDEVGWHIHPSIELAAAAA